LAKTEYYADFQLIGNRIEQLKINNDFIVIDVDSSSETKKSLKLSHLISDVEIDGEGKLTGILSLNVKVKLVRAKEKCSVDLTLEGCFNASGDLGEDRFRSMLEVNGLSTLYNMARSVLISITSQAFVQGSVILPMINVFKYIEGKKEEERKLAEKNQTK